MQDRICRYVRHLHQATFLLAVTTTMSMHYIVEHSQHSTSAIYSSTTELCITVSTLQSLTQSYVPQQQIYYSTAQLQGTPTSTHTLRITLELLTARTYLYHHAMTIKPYSTIANVIIH